KARPARRYAFALTQQPTQARGGFTGMLDGLLERLREQARSCEDTGSVVRAIAQVLDGRTSAQGNVNPELVPAVVRRSWEAAVAGPGRRQGGGPDGGGDGSSHGGVGRAADGLRHGESRRPRHGDRKSAVAREDGRYAR